MNRTIVGVMVFGLTALGLSAVPSAQAQNAVLSEMYGRGVHAYYAGQYDDANQYLTMAIDNGIQDPRAHYFRGMVAHSSGRAYEAEADWQAGAEMEAAGRANPSIGRSLARFQGTARIKLEEIRQQARLKAMATAMERSRQRYGELGVSPDGSAAAAPPTAAAPSAAAPSAAAPSAAATPPAAPPPAGAEDPFADDAMVAGQPNVTSDDAFEGALEDPFADDAGGMAAGAAPGADANPFGGDAGGGADPFGGAGAGDDPFGGAGGGDDPFGGAGGGDDPFGGAGGEDPFGGDPFN